jgi:hypothetical protein
VRHPTSTLLSHDDASGSNRAAVAEREAAAATAAAKSRACRRMRIRTLYYIDHSPPIAILTLPPWLCSLRLYPSFNLHNIHSHILVKFLREDRYISITVRTIAPSALGTSSSQHPGVAAVAFGTAFSLEAVELPARQVALKQGGAICGCEKSEWTRCSRYICT